MDSLPAVSYIEAARLEGQNPLQLWNVTIKAGRVHDVVRYDPAFPAPHAGTINARGRLLLPSLCHAHVHLDKCFILQDARFIDHEIRSGDFSEAVRITNAAKELFDKANLLRRGRRLITASLTAGVTHLRAYVEVDEIIGLAGIEVALSLRETYKYHCNIQICAFAQLALFESSDMAQKRRKLLLEALQNPAVEVIGSTPYVEDGQKVSEENIRWVVEQALVHEKHLDFHLDYNLDPRATPMIWYLLDRLVELWPKDFPKTICLGHCTRFTMFSNEVMKSLKAAIDEHQLPISLVGLPTSDLYMMGRPHDSTTTSDRPRGTLQIPHLVENYGLNCAIAVNNVGNAFTPHSSCDPLHLASLGMLIYQAATIEDCKLLYNCVSTSAKAALGHAGPPLKIQPGCPADLVLFGEEGWQAPVSVADVVYRTETERTVIYQGREVARSSRQSTVLGS